MRFLGGVRSRTRQGHPPVPRGRDEGVSGDEKGRFPHDGSARADTGRDHRFIASRGLGGGRVAERDGRTARLGPEIEGIV